MLFFTWLLFRIVIQYIPYNTDVGFLKIKQQYIDIDGWRYAFFVHVYSSMFVLFAGFTQFSKKLRSNYPSAHRILGYVYVCDIMLITGPASLVMGFYANGGITSKISFVTLSLLWIYFTFRAVKDARSGKMLSHQKFMIRSYALTLSAVTLRAWKFGIAHTLSVAPMDTYRIVAWLSWTINLIFAEWYIRKFINEENNQSSSIPLRETL